MITFDIVLLISDIIAKYQIDMHSSSTTSDPDMHEFDMVAKPCFDYAASDDNDRLSLSLMKSETISDVFPGDDPRRATASDASSGDVQRRRSDVPCRAVVSDVLAGPSDSSSRSDVASRSSNRLCEFCGRQRHSLRTCRRYARVLRYFRMLSDESQRGDEEQLLLMFSASRSLSMPTFLRCTTSLTTSAATSSDVSVQKPDDEIQTASDVSIQQPSDLNQTRSDESVLSDLNQTRSDESVPMARDLNQTVSDVSALMASDLTQMKMPNIFSTSSPSPCPSTTTAPTRPSRPQREDQRGLRGPHRFYRGLRGPHRFLIRLRLVLDCRRVHAIYFRVLLRLHRRCLRLPTWP